jgi:6-phosphofructokinase
MSNTMQRMGILTGGGDCPGLNAVIRAAVKTAINEYGWEVLGIEDGFEGLIKPNKARLLALTDVRAAPGVARSWEVRIGRTLSLESAPTVRSKS